VLPAAPLTDVSPPGFASRLVNRMTCILDVVNRKIADLAPDGFAHGPGSSVRGGLGQTARCFPHSTNGCVADPVPLKRSRTRGSVIHFAPFEVGWGFAL
jgi:hypothetical protein